MGIEIPDSLKPIAAVVATDWPECDETAIERMADHWEDMAGTLTEIRDEGDAITQALLARISGDTNASIQQFWQSAGGDLDGLVTFCNAIAFACRVMAMLIRAVKIYIIAMLVELAINLAIAAALAVETFGASMAEGAAAQAITRTLVRQALKELLQKILKETIIEAFKGFMQGAGKELAWQAGETALGLRDGIDLGDVAQAGAHNAISNAVTGGLNAGLDGILDSGGTHRTRPDSGTDAENDGGIREKIDELGGNAADSVVEGPDDDKERLQNDAGELLENWLGLSEEEPAAGDEPAESPPAEPQPAEAPEAEAPPLEPVLTAPPATGFSLNMGPDTFYRDDEAGRLRLDN